MVVLIYKCYIRDLALRVTKPKPNASNFSTASNRSFSTPLWPPLTKFSFLFHWWFYGFSI